MFNIVKIGVQVEPSFDLQGKCPLCYKGFVPKEPVQYTVFGNIDTGACVPTHIECVKQEMES